MSDPITEYIDQQIEKRVKPLKAEIADLKSRIPDSSWGITRVAKELGVSVTTVYRRIENDAQFPRPIPKQKYFQNGQWRLPRDKWNPDHIREYKLSS